MPSPDVTGTVIEEEGDCATEIDRPAVPPVLLSIPALDVIGDRVFTASHLDQDAATDAAKSVTGTASVVALSIPEANLLQAFVQDAKQRVIDLASGSVFWRLFVGSGVALLIGAVTLVLFGPSRDQIQSDETADVASHLRTVDQTPDKPTVKSLSKASSSRIELTVNQSPQEGAAPAEFDDPFTAAKLVSPQVQQAVHFADSSDHDGVIQTVSHTKPVVSQPVWLSGTIDVEDNVDQTPLKRKHERSRPSNR